MIKVTSWKVVIGVVLLLAGCAGGKDKKDAKEPVKGGKEASPGAQPEEATTKLDGERRFLVTSLSNSPLTSRSIDRGRAADFAAQDSAAKNQDINMLAALLSANRLAGRSVEETLAVAKRISDLVMTKGVDKDLPESIQLELALTGVQTGRLAFAEFWFDKLYKSKNQGIRASIMNAKGVMAVRMERIPEAMSMFKEALALNGEYKPALLNIGFLALQGGDVETAQKALSGLSGDWYAEAGLISVFRMQGEADKAQASCDKILQEHPKNKQTLINCGINAWQGKKDYAKARELLGKALTIPGGAIVWDEKAGKIMGVLDGEEDRAKQAKSLKDAADRKQAKEKASAAGGAPAAGDAPAKPAP
jgi:tetratricopeptide (TPR) repeat protein